MKAATPQTKTWSNAQAYSLAVTCLMVGIGSGYLGRRQSATPLPTPQRASTPQIVRAGHPEVQDAPSPEQMKAMGDKMAEPMLVQLQKEPKNAKLLSSIASVYFRTQQFDTAAGYYERSIKIAPTAEKLTALASCYHYAGDSDKAIATLNRALQFDPNWTDALFNIGLIKWQVKDDPKGAIESWQRLLKANPNHPRRAFVERMIADAQKHLSMPDTPAKPTM